MRQIFVNGLPRLTAEPSGKVTSLSKDAASHLVMGWRGGTAVNVLKTMGLDVGMESMLVGEGCTVSVVTACVDIASRVCAAEVYSALRVAAGWGVGAMNWLHARMKTSDSIKKRIFLNRLICISDSN